MLVDPSPTSERFVLKVEDIIYRGIINGGTSTSGKPGILQRTFELESAE